MNINKQNSDFLAGIELGRREGKSEERKRIIKLFKEDSIYTGAVIKYEINSKK